MAPFASVAVAVTVTATGEVVATAVLLPVRVSVAFPVVVEDKGPKLPAMPLGKPLTARPVEVGDRTVGVPTAVTCTTSVEVAAEDMETAAVCGATSKPGA